jgi:hypothetical protein
MKTFILLYLMVLVPLAHAGKEFEIFDGHFYNQLYYPLVDNIEWGEQDGELPHMEFHVHQKDQQIEVTVVPGLKGATPVFWIVYDLRFRNERVCRHIAAPAQFKEGTKVYAYKDTTDPDYNNFLFYSFPVKAKNLVEYTMPAYQPCLDENASNRPEPGNRAVASTPSSPGAPVTSPAEKKDPKNIGVDYDNSAVPFSF